MKVDFVLWNLLHAPDGTNKLSQQEAVKVYHCALDADKIGIFVWQGPYGGLPTESTVDISVFEP